MCIDPTVTIHSVVVDLIIFSVLRFYVSNSYYQEFIMERRMVNCCIGCKIKSVKSFLICLGFQINVISVNYHKVVTPL